MKLKLLLCTLFFTGVSLHAQDYFPTNEGVKTQNTNFTVFENAKIHVDPNTVIENGMFAVRDGKITAIGKSINVPANSHRIDLKGKEVYPSFIDVYSEFGIKKPQRNGNNSNQPQYEAEREGYYWNDHIRPETNAVQHFSFSKEEAGKFHKGGFGVVNTHMPDGIIRGTGILVALNPDGTEGERILTDRSSQFLSFDKSVQSRQAYPTSIMGAMALIRQSYMDADWYSKGNASNRDLALEALNSNKDLVQVFKTDNILDALRAGKIGREFNMNYVILGSGQEYERINEVKNTNATFIIPLDFPDAYDVEDPFMANYVSLQDMKRWNQTPANLKVLAENNVPFVITMHNSKDEKKFRENLLKAVSYGLDKKVALAALTTVPAKTLKQENNLGALKQGAWANFIITSGDYFEEETVIYENWVQGRRAILENMNTVDLAGTYDLKINNNTYEVKITGKPTDPKVEVKDGENKLKSKITYSEGWMNLLISSADTTKTQFTRLVAQVPSPSEIISGKAILPTGSETSFTATRKGEPEDSKKEEDKKVADVVPVTFPNMAYGSREMPKQENILFRNATVWTNTNEGILKETDVLINNGKISRVGKNLNAGNARVIDATGKHLTAGIIDEHTHIAASAINEAGHNSTAEVTMEDVVDPTDINIYRNLAGGVTAVQLLHGSANPIGGRSA
ncbi:MAG TPA: hypothetical protein VK941_14760, partial [Gillisia sp.]|nr:hypothetical protein [Gillisia sp.]